MALKWESNRKLATADGWASAATRWWASSTALAGTYHIEKDPSWRSIYYVTYVGPDGSGRACTTKIGSAYTVKEAKQIATEHDWHV